MNPGPYRIVFGVALGHLVLIGLILKFGIGSVIPPTPVPIQLQLISPSANSTQRAMRPDTLPKAASTAQQAAGQTKAPGKPPPKQPAVVTPSMPTAETSRPASQSIASSPSAHVDPKSGVAISAGNVGATGTTAPSLSAAGSPAVGASGDAGPRVDASFRGNRLPEYPAMSRRLGEQGIVILRVFITPEGRAADVQLVKSSGSTRLDRSAMETIREWRFLPARQAGRPVGAWYEWRWEFRLDG